MTNSTINSFKKLKKFFIPAYILILVGSFLYVRQVLNSNNLEVAQKSTEVKKVVKTEIFTSTLNLINGTNTSQFKAKLSNQDSVLNFLIYLRANKQLTYEKTDYIDKLVIDNVNGQPVSDGYVWKVLDGDNDITNAIGSTKLRKDTAYTLKLIKL
jgi:hypothetical protein